MRNYISTILPSGEQQGVYLFSIVRSVDVCTPLYKLILISHMCFNKGFVV